MHLTDSFTNLGTHWQEYILVLIQSQLVGKHANNSEVIKIENSDLKTYHFKVTVTKKVKEKEVTAIGYLRSDAFKGGKWELTKRPRLMQGEKAPAGVFGIYG